MSQSRCARVGKTKRLAFYRRNGLVRPEERLELEREALGRELERETLGREVERVGAERARVGVDRARVGEVAREVERARVGVLGLAVVARVRDGTEVRDARAVERVDGRETEEARVGEVERPL